MGNRKPQGWKSSISYRRHKTASGFSRRRRFPVLAALVAISAAAFIGYTVWSPGLDIRDGIHDLGSNAIWLQHGWLGSDDWFRRNKKVELIKKFRGDQQIQGLAALLRQHHIVDVFPHLCPTSVSGNLPGVHAEQTERFLRELPGFRVMPWVGGVLGVQVFLEDKNWRGTFASSIRSLLVDYQGFAGIHINIEPCPSGDPNFLYLLEEIRKALPPNKVISVAACPPPTWFQPSADMNWDREYYQKVASKADQMVIMMYNTGIRWQKPYHYLMSTWTRQVLDWSPKTEVLLGLPAYEDKGVSYHFPEVENLNNALAGMHSGLTSYPSLHKNYRGIALYCEWEMNDSKWSYLREHFLRAK